MRRTVVGAITAVALSLAVTGADAQSADDRKANQHEVQGEVTRVDAKKGWVHVKTSEGTMIVHFPPADIQDLQKGDMVTLRLALKDNGPAPKK
jgi:hypothetical protein